MIKANELRIGNIFNYHGVDVIVLAVDRYKVTFGYFTDSFGFERKYDDIDFPKPIVINNERLFRFGFYSSPVINGLSFQFGYNVIWWTNNKIYLAGMDCPNENYAIATYPMFIHELQNLFFYLTGQELQLTNSNTTL